MPKKVPPDQRAPVEERGKPGASLGLKDWPDIMTLREAAAKVNMSAPVLREAIKDGSLVAFIPRGRHPQRTGPRMGYRIKRADLEAWYFHKPASS